MDPYLIDASPGNPCNAFFQDAQQESGSPCLNCVVIVSSKFVPAILANRSTSAVVKSYILLPQHPLHAQLHPFPFFPMQVEFRTCIFSLQSSSLSWASKHSFGTATSLFCCPMATRIATTLRIIFYMKSRWQIVACPHYHLWWKRWPWRFDFVDRVLGGCVNRLTFLSRQTLWLAGWCNVPSYS